ncbi:MAG: T9SS type A sorting domain-containing protein, partial [Bacteroidota bacterium]
VKVFAPSNIIVDQDGLSNFQSDTLTVLYREAPQPFGIYGPAGVGNQDELAIWLDASKGVFDENGNEVTEVGTEVQSWSDVFGNGLSADQQDLTALPSYQTGETGINGMPALRFDGVGDKLLLSGLPSPENPSIFAIAKGSQQEFNDHGWIASSRGANGYVLHPWKESALYHSIIIDAEGNYADAPQQWVVDAGATHIYGTIYERTDFGAKFLTVFDGITIDWGNSAIGPRVDGAPIDVNIGWDFDDRYGDGLIAEHFVYTRTIQESHRKLIASYLAAKYAIDIGPTSKFDLDLYPFEVAGIGQESQYDYHLEAQGTGLVKMNVESLDNGDYFMIGHDNGAMEWEDNGFPLTSTRLTRTWGYQETQDCEDITLQFDLSEVENIPAGIGLIVETSPYFFVGGEPGFYPLTDIGDGWYEVTLDFWNAGVFTIGLSPTVGVADFDEVNWMVYPNPSEGNINLQLPMWDQSIDIKVYSVTGSLMWSGNSVGGTTVIPSENWSDGVYHVQINDGRSVGVTKFILN